MNRFIIFKEDEMYKLEGKINDFLKDNPNIQIISHSIVIREYRITNDEYICTIIYKI